MQISASLFTHGGAPVLLAGLQPQMFVFILPETFSGVLSAFSGIAQHGTFICHSLGTKADLLK